MPTACSNGDCLLHGSVWQVTSNGHLGQIKGQGIEDRRPWLWKGLQIASKGHSSWFESSVAMSDFKMQFAKSAASCLPAVFCFQ